MARKKTAVPTLRKMTAPGDVDMRQLSNLGIDGDGYMWESTIRELRGHKAFRVYREMADHSAVIGACLLALKSLIRKVTWKVEPGDSSTEELERAEKLQSMLEDMSTSWPDTVTDILSMLIYGHSYLEIVYKIRRGPMESDSRFRSKYSDGAVGWRKWVLVPQETLHEWEWDEYGGLRAMLQIGQSDFRVRRVPIEKALLFKTESARGNPNGRSLLMNAYYPWQFTKRIQEWESIGVERDLAGLPFAGIPPEYFDPSASPEEKAMLESFKKLITGVRQNENAGIIFPLAFDDENNPLFDFKLLSASGMKQFDTGKIIERHERRMAMSLLSDVVLMGHEKVGSLALSRDKSTLIGRFVAAVLQSISEVVNRHAVTRIYELNDWPMDKMSRFVPGEAENADIKNLGQYIRNLVSVGAITPDPGLEAALREAGGLPMIDPEYQLEPGETRLLPGTASDPAAMENDEDPDADPEKDPEKDPKRDPKDKPKKSAPVEDIVEAVRSRRQRRKAA